MSVLLISPLPVCIQRHLAQPGLWPGPGLSEAGPALGMQGEGRWQPPESGIPGLAAVGPPVGQALWAACVKGRRMYKAAGAGPGLPRAPH